MDINWIIGYIIVFSVLYAFIGSSLLAFQEEKPNFANMVMLILGWPVAMVCLAGFYFGAWVKHKFL